jgi:hypothetical protein
MFGAKDLLTRLTALSRRDSCHEVRAVGVSLGRTHVRRVTAVLLQPFCS